MKSVLIYQEHLKEIIETEKARVHRLQEKYPDFKEYYEGKLATFDTMLYLIDNGQLPEEGE